MNKKIVLALVVLTFAHSCNLNQSDVPSNMFDDAVLEVKGKQLKIEEAKTNVEKTRGLSGLPIIAEDQGMLFYFDTFSRHSIWMKGMKFPIDIIWLENDEVVEITPNVLHQPNVADSELKVYSPSQEVNRVLELPAGWSLNNNLQIGDKIMIKYP